MRILVIRPGALGDTLMLAPALSEMIGVEDIALIARRPGLDILRPFVREAMDYESGGWHRLFMDDPLVVHNEMCDDLTKPSPSGDHVAVPFMVRQAHHERTITRQESINKPLVLSLPKDEQRITTQSPTGNGQSLGGRIDLVVAFLSDRSGKVRANLQALMPGSSIRVFSPFPAKGEEIHTALYLAECMRSSGCGVNPSKAVEEAVRRPLMEGEFFRVPEDGRRIVFHPGSGGASKNHPPEFWTSLVRGFSAALPGRNPLAILLGPAEESCLPFYQRQLRSHVAEIVFSPEVESLLRLLKNTPLYIGLDSGITHLAAMLGTSTIALFKSSSLAQWKPLGPRVKLLEGESGPDLIDRVYERAREMVP